MRLRRAGFLAQAEGPGDGVLQARTVGRIDSMSKSFAECS